MNNYKLIENKNMYFKLSKQETDVLIIDERNIILLKYLNMPRFKIVKVKNDKKKTKVLILPKNYSFGLKIGDVLPLESKHVI